MPRWRSRTKEQAIRWKSCAPGRSELLTTIRPSYGEFRYAMFETFSASPPKQLDDASELTAIQQRHADTIGDFIERAGSPSIPFRTRGYGSSGSTAKAQTFDPPCSY